MFTFSAVTVMLMGSVTPIEENVLTLEQVVSAACENRAEMMQAELSVSSAEAGMQRATFWFTPTVSASAGINGVETEFPEAESFSSSIGLNANMSLFNLQSIGTRRASAVALDMAEESARTSRAAVIFDAVSSWYSLLQVQTAEMNLSTQEEAFRLVEAKYDAGMVSRYEYLAGHVSLENTRPAFTIAVSSLENALGNMSLATGLQIGKTTKIDGSLADVLSVTIPGSPEELAETAVQNSTEALIARLSLQSAEAQSFTVRAGYAPTVDLNGSVSWGNSTAEFSDLGDNDLTRTSSAGVSINLPIFTSLINETDLKTTRYAELTAEFELERVEDEVRQRALEAWNSYQCASQRLTGASALVLEAQEALAIAEITYQAGSITRLDLEQSILGLTSARESRSEALLAMRMAELNIAMLSGEIHEIWEVE
jgi:outer membrane protein